MKIIDGTNAVLGRLASYVAKQALKGEEFAIVNCGQIIITGNRKNIEEKQFASRQRVGSGQKGPKISRLAHLIVKKTIRGMLPNYRKGRGKQAFQRIKCYVGIPKEFEDKKKIIAGKKITTKFVTIKQISKENVK